MKYLICLLFFAGTFKEEIELDEPQVHIKQKVEVFLWLPPKRHVDNIRTQKNWAIYRYLKKHEKELDLIADFRIIDTNLMVKTIEFKYRIGGGPINPFPTVKIKKGEGFYKHIRYLILLNRYVVEHPKLNSYSFPLKKRKMFRWELGNQKDGDVYQPFYGLRYEFSRDIVNPVLKISPPVRFENNPEVKMIYRDKKNLFGITYRRKVDNKIEFVKKIDYKSNILVDLINDLIKEKKEGSKP